MSGLRVAVVAGGVGAARYLAGLLQEVDASAVTVVVNTADDVVLHGLHVSPDLDTVTYTLAGAVDRERGWGLTGETWQAMDAVGRYAPHAPAGSCAGTTWFRLGDRDLATHLYRSGRLAEGAPLSIVTAEIARAWGLGLTILPMSDDPVETRVTLAADEEIGFQEYFVERRHDVAVTSVRFEGADSATPAPGVLDALGDADRVVIAPSNPLVSIAPVLAVAGVRPLLERRRHDVVAVSPIIAGAALKGPAARLLTELGHEASVVGVARLYAPLAATLVVDTADVGRVAEVEAAGIRCVVAPTIMTGPTEAAALAEVTLR